jgi:EF-hand domain pair
VVRQGRKQTDTSAVASSAGFHAVSGASYGAPPQQKMSNLFDSIDTSGTGSISQAQFQNAFQTKNPPAVFQKQGADAIFAALDPNGTGSVSKQDFVKTMSSLMASLRAGDATQSSSGASTSLATSLQTLNQIDSASVPSNSQPGAFFNRSV